MLSSWALILPFLGLASLVGAKSSAGNSVLVILEPNLKKDDFSIFFKDLEEQGYALTFRAPREVKPLIIEDDIPAFSNVVLFTPETKSYAQDITPQSLVSLLSGNTNLLIALSPKQTPLTSLAAEFSLIPPPPGTPLISHFPKRDTPATVIPIQPPKSDILTSGLPPVWFSGASHSLGNNPFLVPILSAPAESFAADSKEDATADSIVDAAEKGGEGLWAGSQMGVVTGFQARSGARATWVGGVDLFSDAFAQKELSKGVKSGNQQFTRDISAWTFQESLVLRIDNTTHHRVGEASPAEHYTTNDQVVFTTLISKYNPKKSAWEPYSGIKDLQLEFTMLDPHIRTALLPVKGVPGKYSVTFRVPDRHGVFKFIVDYKRKGWTHLHSSTVVPVVPPRHDGYPRFLSAAWPYYAGAISTSLGFILFSALWLSGDAREVKKGKGTKSE
jgi:oligosaccharyltransferase complex subunit beta